MKYLKTSIFEVIFGRTYLNMRRKKKRRRQGFLAKPEKTFQNFKLECSYDGSCFNLKVRPWLSFKFFVELINTLARENDIPWNRGFILPFEQIDSMLPCVCQVIDHQGESKNAARQKGGKQTASLIFRRPRSFTAPSLVRFPLGKGRGSEIDIGPLRIRPTSRRQVPLE